MAGLTKFVVTNHKTGTRVMQGVLRDYCKTYELRLLELQHHMSQNEDRIDPNIDFQSYDFIYVPHAQHFEQLIDVAPDLSYRVAHLIRNPLEIIMSGVRYHRVTTEEWSGQKLFVADSSGPCGYRRIAWNGAPPRDRTGEFSYKEIMNSLPLTQQIEFEIKNHRKTFGTIPAISSFIRRFESDINVANVRLEEIATEECIDFVVRFLELKPEFKDAYRLKVSTKSWLGRHVTHPKGGETHQAAFSPRLYALFEAEFGEGVAQRFGYGAEANASVQISRYESMLAAIGDTRPLETPQDEPAFAEAAGDARKLLAFGEARLAEGKLPWASAAFRAALEQDANSLGALAKLARICALQADFEGAISYYGRVLAVAKSPPAWAYIGLANGFAALDRKAEAIDNFRLAIPLMPDPAAVKSRLAKLEDGRP